jgi:hypothetical protein
MTSAIIAKMEGPNSSIRRRITEGDSGGRDTGDGDDSSPLLAEANSFSVRHGGGGDRSSALVRALAGGGDFSLWRRENLLFPSEESKEDKWPIICPVWRFVFPVVRFMLIQPPLNMREPLERSFNV